MKDTTRVRGSSRALTAGLIALATAGGVVADTAQGQTFAGARSASSTRFTNNLLLARAIQNWNAFYGANVVATGISDEGPILDDARRVAVVGLMTDTTTTFMPSGDVTMPHTMWALPISADPTIPGVKIGEWRMRIDRTVSVGDRVVRVHWRRVDGRLFDTYCVLRGSMIKYDSMLSNIAFFGGGPRRTVFNYRMGWAWQSDFNDMTRGSIVVDGTASCRNGQVICTENCTASMSLGEADVNCKSSHIAGTECCKVEYSWAWACGFTSIKVGNDDFTLEVEGIIGSSGSGNGSAIVCCGEGQPLRDPDFPAVNPADADRNGVVDADDYARFVEDLLAGRRDADLNADGAIDTIDLERFVQEYQAAR